MSIALQTHAKATPNPTFTPVRSSLLQRKCTCGGTRGDCEECSKKNRVSLQTKLKVNEPGDRYEQEADRIADQVLAAPVQPAVSSSPPRIQRFSKQSNPKAKEAPVSVERALADPGRPLEAALRRDMEQRFGHDFSKVRVHTGAAVEQSARDVNARAYTAGEDIVFGAGEYAPHTQRGRHVLAHELTHVVQQGGDLAAGKPASRLQRLSLSDVLEKAALQLLGPAAGQLINLYKQPIDDLVDSVKESPQHVGEFLKDEVWEAIKAHWTRIMAVSIGLIIAELAVGVLTAIPEPTMLTKVIAVILQIAIIAIIGYFSAVEVKGAYEEGRKWFSTATSAKGNPTEITNASRSFVRMVWHIILAVVAVAGVRARVRGATVPEGTAAASGAGGGGEVIPISSHPKFRSKVDTPAPSGNIGQPSGYYGPGGAAPKLEPFQLPVPETVPVAVRAPTPIRGTAPSAATGPGVQAVPAVAAGVSAAKRKDQLYPICWATQLGPITQATFVRTKSARDDDEAKQARMALEWRRLRDPDFDPKRFHVHHVCPLFLGGKDDLKINATILEKHIHLKGHRVLQKQPQMLTPPLTPLPANMYKHPVGTRYRLVGYKSEPNEFCGT